MQTFPCGHVVVCRKCFIKTIQVAVTQRSLPLKCVVCRTKILKLKQTAEESLSSQSSRNPVQLPGQQGSSGQKMSKPAMLARHWLLGSSGSSGTKHQGASSTSASSKGHESYPVVATKIMKPLLIYPSQTSPKQQRAFSSENTASSPKHSAARAHYPDYKTDSPKRGPSQRPLVASTDSPLISGRAWAARHKCQHSTGLETKYTHILSPRVTSRCSHCSPVSRAPFKVVKQGV